MNTVITRNRWTTKEVNLAKQTLKLMNGNQTKAARILSEKIGRPVASIQVKLCTLAKKHPSLRKKNIAKRMTKSAPVASSVTKQVKNVEVRGNQLIITF
jgi:hypothetical protein